MTDRSSELEASPFHPGELVAQDRAGVLEDADFLGRRMIRPFLTEQARQFFPQLPYVFVGSMDDAGQLWASMLVGAPGFVHSPTPLTLAVDAHVATGDPLASALRPGAALGMLGIQLETRRRNRVNGHIRELNADGFVLQVDQSYGNCPRYISRRAAEPQQPRAAGQLARAESALLSDDALAILGSADTLFLASASGQGRAESDTREGVDVSHRGGRPGFVRIERSATGTRLLIPDYPGNNMFNTFGNLTRYPRAGLLVPSFESGDVLLVTCNAEVIWQGKELEQFAADEQVERAIALHIRSGLYFDRFMPFSWKEPVAKAQRLVG